MTFSSFPCRLTLTLAVCLTGASLAQAQTATDRTSSTLAPPPAGLTLNLEGRSTPQGEVFRAGFLADGAPDHQQRLYVPFRDHMETVLQRPVELTPYRDARGLMLAIRRGDIGYAMAPASVLAATHRLCNCVVPLASQPGYNGSAGIFSVVLAASDGPIDSLNTLRNARLIVVGEGSVVTHRIGLAELFNQDAQPDEEALAFVPTLREAVDVLEAGQADAILTWSRQSEGKVLMDQEPMSELGAEGRSALQIIWRSRVLPGYSHFSHANLDEATQQALQSMIVRLTVSNGDAFDAVDQGSGRAFEARALSDYQPYLDAYAYWDRVPDP